MITVIPFSGFYNSAHDDALDDALDSYFQNDNGDPNENLTARAFDCISWRKVHEEYAAAYADAFAAEFEIVGAKFESMQSPREYNFTTDRIYVDIPDGELARIHGEVPPLTLAAVAEEMFTSRSGFISFYSPDTTTWGPLDEWDHNQLLALIQAYVQTFDDDFDMWKEFDLMVGYRDNAYFENWLSDAGGKGMHRLDRVYSYLRDREARTSPWRTA